MSQKFNRGVENTITKLLGQTFDPKNKLERVKIFILTKFLSPEFSKIYGYEK